MQYIAFDSHFKSLKILPFQKQPSRGVLKKRCSENMQQIYRRTPMPKCDFNKVAKQLYWNRTSAWVFSCKFAEYFKNTFSWESLWMAASENSFVSGIGKYDYYTEISFCRPKDLVWHWYCLFQYNVTDENQLLFLYLGRTLKWV